MNAGFLLATTNRHLVPIIEHVAERFPHVGMNFFTNAITLDRPRLIETLVGNVRWINASLKAATRESWKDQCKVDLFDRVCRNLRTLHRTKRHRASLLPLVFGSMVLTRANLADLPRMPALCRDLGIDRFSAFPYFGLGYHGTDRYGPKMTLETCRREYEDLYWVTVQETEAHRVSLEIPLPGSQKRTAFGVEARPVHDFARVESNEWKLGRFVFHLDYDAPRAHCPALWRSAGIGSTHKGVTPRTRRIPCIRASARCPVWTCRCGRPFAFPASMSSSACGGILSSRYFDARNANRASARYVTCAAATTRAIRSTFPSWSEPWPSSLTSTAAFRSALRPPRVDQSGGARDTGQSPPHAPPARQRRARRGRRRA
jgi:MoaA/NifB/PqqE/SkfB family radical SAM enzyme